MKIFTKKRTNYFTTLLTVLIFFIALSACNKKDVSIADVLTQPPPDVLAPPLPPSATPTDIPVATPSAETPPAETPPTNADIDKLDGKCVQVFYDNSTDPIYKFSRTHALMLLNLLGHFPEYQQIIGPIELYKKGNLDRCHASFYIGSFYDNPLPQDFLMDFKSTTRQVVWMGYNFWQLGAEFEAAFGYKDYIFTTLDYANPTSDGKPGFFRDVIYKGEMFHKFSTWGSVPPPENMIPPANPQGPLPPPPAQALVAAFEVTKLSNKTSAVSEVMAEIKHSFTGETIPWAIRAQNKFYVVESPFSFIHEADRYLVFADLLFDFLKAEPKDNSKNAVLRLEDIHAYVELNYLEEAVNILKNRSVTPHISIIPIFKDPFFSVARDDMRAEIRMEEVPQFASLVQRYKSEGSVFIWHGITHQYNEVKNPFSASSGDDYEFWDFIKNSPVAEDSVNFVLDKFENGFNSLKQFAIAPQIWLGPHYHASALDNVMFGKMFKWVIGRGVYSDFTVSGLKVIEKTKPISFDVENLDTTQNRQDFFAALQVNAVPGFKQFGQIYPYEIYGNIYGQNVIPENLGNVQPYLNNQVINTRDVTRILEDAKRNLILRDVWASVFYHPFLLDPVLNAENANPAEPKDLDRLVSGLQTLGYKFINLDSYVVNASTEKAKPKIEIADIKK